MLEAGRVNEKNQMFPETFQFQRRLTSHSPAIDLNRQAGCYDHSPKIAGQ
jgi:hypothetical protein